MGKYTIRKQHGQEYIYTSIQNGVKYMSMIAAKNMLNKQDKRITELEKHMGKDLALLRDQKAQLNAVRKVLIEFETESWKPWHKRVTQALEGE